jgi:hypothetical protein
MTDLVIKQIQLTDNNDTVVCIQFGNLVYFYKQLIFNCV